MQLEKVNLTGAQETTLATLYGKAMESRRPDSILNDSEADRALRRIDYDFSRLRIRRTDHTSLAVRAKAYDGWARQVLDRHPDCTVLHLGCGLDTRVYRVDAPPTVRWYDVDFPDVIELRRRLFPPRDGMHTVAASVTDPELLDGIAGDTPVLVIAEGLTPYLRPSTASRCCAASPSTSPAVKCFSTVTADSACGFCSAMDASKCPARNWAGPSTTHTKSKGRSQD
jgi:O-methyltransferase involved in polyketide biosynthesis